MITAKTEKLLNVKGNHLQVLFEKTVENRPILVFLHDSLGCITLWRNFPFDLAQASNCNVLIYDRLGYGKSEPMPTYVRPVNYLEEEVGVLNNLLELLEIENAILFGHSDGGSIALIAASKFPSRIKAVICEAAHIFVEEVTLQGIQAAIKAYHTTNLPDRLAKYHGDKVDSIFKAWADTWTRSDYCNWNIEHFLPGINCPLLFIQGEADEYGTLLQVEKTLDQVSGQTEKLIITGIGHTPHKEAPEATFEAAKNFINQL